jgi:DNA repair photolyase
MDWVVDKIKTGYVDVTNPFNRTQVSRVSLNPDHVRCWAWWSKDYQRWIEAYKLNKTLFNTYKGHYFQFTINSPSILEKNLKISLEKRFEQLEWLIEEFGLLSVNFRFDPIIIYKIGDKTKSNLNKFEYIIESVSSLGVKEIIFSFATIYPKVKRRMTARGKIPIEIKGKKKEELTLKLLKKCDKYGLKMKACCQPDLLKLDGIEQAHCIDANKIEKIVGENIPKIRDTGQREDCGCYQSRDIGGYSGIFRCKHNCDYCYANPAKN